MKMISKDSRTTMAENNNKKPVKKKSLLENLRFTFKPAKTKPVKKLTAIVGVFADKDKVYLVERTLNLDIEDYYIPSTDGVNFDATKKFPASMYKGDSYYYIPTPLDKWNHPARNTIQSRNDKFDHANISILGEFHSNRGRLTLYDCSYITYGHQRIVGGAFVTAYHEPVNVVWRSEDPMWAEFLKDDSAKFRPIGAVNFKDKYYIYYNKKDKILSVSLTDPFHEMVTVKKENPIKRYHKNPIMGPKAENHWENFAVFNPGVVAINDKVHMFYRAQGHDHMSGVGYAVSEDGYEFERHDKPVYIPDSRFTKVIRGKAKLYQNGVSGEGWGGCEDPRTTLIDDKVYMLYVAFDGMSEPRLAMSTIGVEDINNKEWENWTDPVFLTPWSKVWGTGIKSGILFPEQVNDRYVFMYRYWPNICIDYVEDLDLGDGKKYLQKRGEIKTRKDKWDSFKIGAGAPPILTDAGWLLIYFGVGYQDKHRYKVGAMILDKDNPEKVLYRSNSPIISPETWYEDEAVIPGSKAGVTYPCGAVVKDGELIIYYGGADVVVCAASCELDKLVYEIKKDEVEEETLKSVYVHA